MANNVSDVSVKLSTDPQQFVKGFEQARASVGPLASAVSNLNTSLTSFNIGGFAGRFASIAAPLQSLAGNLASRNFAGALADTVNLSASIASVGSEALRASASQIRLADQLGTTQAGFQGLSVLANRLGLDMEEVTTGVSKFNSRVGEMRVGLARGEIPPLALALRRLGIDAQRFSELRTNEQLRELADSLQRLPNMQDRRFALSQLFGEREAFLFQRVLGRGGQELLDAENEAVRRGLVLYGDRRTAVEEAARAQRELNAELENSWNAFGREIGVRTAPLARSATRSFQPDTLERSFWTGFFNPGGIFDSAPINETPAIRANRERLEQQRASGGNFDAVYNPNLNPNQDQAEAANRVGENIRNTNAAGEELLNTLRRQTEALGQSAVEVEILRRGLDSINPILANQLREQERINEQRQQQTTQAQRIRGQFDTARPLLNFQTELQRLRNNDQLTPEQRRFGAFQAIQSLESSLPRFETRYTGALQMGSAEAVSAITQARAQQMDSEMAPQQRLATLMERAANSQERLERLMQQYFDSLGRYGISVAPES